MLYGEYRLTIDGKGRVSIPTKMREPLGETFMISRGLKNTLYLYPMDEWHKFEDIIAATPFTKQVDFGLFFFSGAEEAELDSHGRTTISQKFRKLINLDSNIVLIGNKTHIEVWNETAWDEYISKLTPDDVMRELMESGI